MKRFIYLVLMVYSFVPLSSFGNTDFGMVYFLWHCPASEEVYNIRDAIEGRSHWGPRLKFHYWDQPQAGYYCLTNRPDILKWHAELLRDAGVDFIIVDSTNHAYFNQNALESQKMIQQPFTKLLEVWSQVPNAPKIVPWVPIFEGATMVNFLNAELDRYPQLKYYFKGKPLLLAVGHNFTESRIAEFQHKYTIRKMWGHISPQQLAAGQWSFLQSCQPGFLESQGRAECNQGITFRETQMESISITTAYQVTLMTDFNTSVPKFQGRTFERQFETLERNPQIEVATITGWNEWIAQRFCPGGALSGCAAHESGFVDAYNEEYNRDIEPGGQSGNYSYNLLHHKIHQFRNERTEPASPIGNIDGILDSGKIRGWAFDPNRKHHQVSIHFYAGGPPGQGNFVGATNTQNWREDVNITFSASGYHGFEFHLPPDAKGKEIFVYAIDIDGRAPNDQIGTSVLYPGDPEPIENTLPRGHLDVFESNGRISGWAFDPNNSSTSIQIKVYIRQNGGAKFLVGSVTANSPRPDVNIAFGIQGQHGFQYQIPQRYLAGEVEVFPVAVDLQEGVVHVENAPQRQRYEVERPPSDQNTMLFRYFKAGFHRITRFDVDSSWTREGPLGHIWLANDRQKQILMECRVGEVDYFLSLDRNCEGQQIVQKLGYISIVPTGGPALYRCFVPSTGNHFASHDPACEGQTTESRLGYLNP